MNENPCQILSYAKHVCIYAFFFSISHLKYNHRRHWHFLLHYSALLFQTFTRPLLGKKCMKSILLILYPKWWLQQFFSKRWFRLLFEKLFSSFWGRKNDVYIPAFISVVFSSFFMVKSIFDMFESLSEFSHKVSKR